MSVRKIETMKDINELHLDSRSANTIAVHGYSVSVLITAARCNTLEKLDGIGPVTAKRITQAVDEAGFILHESVISQGARSLLAAAFYLPLGTAEEYEARVEFTVQQERELLTFLKTLTHQEATVLEMRFGLEGFMPMNLREIADYLGVSRERIRYAEANALRKLRHPTRKKVLEEIFPGWIGFEMSKPRRTGKYNGPVENMPIEEMPCVSVKAYNCLRWAKIYTVGQLTKLTYAEVRKIRNMSIRDTENVVSSLLAIGCDLRVEPEA